jgi:hypothetical protein
LLADPFEILWLAALEKPVNHDKQCISVQMLKKKGVQDLPEPRASLVFLPPKTREIVLFFVKSSLT